MHLVFNKEELVNVLSVLSSVASGRNTLPILSNVKFDAYDGQVKCVATDLDVGITLNVQAQIHEDGSITVNCKKILDIVKQLPDDLPIGFETTANDRVQLQCGGGVYKIIGLTSEEFPNLPTFEKEGSLELDAQHLIDVLNKVEYAACKDDVRYFLNGVYFNFLEDKTELAATDSRIMAVAELPPYTPPDDKNGFILPLKSVKEVLNTFSESAEVRIAVEDKQILFSDDFATLSSRLVEGEYPNYRGIIPTEHQGKTIVIKDDLLKCVKRVSLLANPRNYGIIIDIDEQSLMVSANTPDLGEALESISVVSSNMNIRFSVDSRLFIENILSIKGDNIVLEYQEPSTPIVLKPVDTQDQLSLVMPLKLDESGKSEEPKEPEEAKEPDEPKEE